MSLYTLLVGVNAYQSPVKALRGCRNDIEQAAEYLKERTGPDELFQRCLYDGEATRQAVIDGFRGHLGHAGPGDTALFWFSGHGSEAPVPPELSRLEPIGMLQTLLCVDSRHGAAPDLYDKELAVLISEVAGRGAHVAVVLDCCHADSADRLVPAQGGSATGIPSLTARWEPALTAPPPLRALLAELRASAPLDADRAAAAGRTGPDHVTLAACHSNQVAYEVGLAGRPSGAFSLGLLNQLNILGSGATYRELMTGVRCYVENLVPRQRPVLSPIAEDIVDQPFLGGRLRAANSTTTMRFVHRAWEIDAGACHGVALGADEDRTLVGVHCDEPEEEIREARVVEVSPDHSIVEPIGDWRPHPGRQYPVVVTRVPLPATTVAIGAGPGDDPDTARLIATALSKAGPARRPSPHAREVSSADPDRAPEIRVVIPEPGVVRVLGLDGSALIPDTTQVTSAESAATVVADIEHIARWRQIKALANPLSGLAGAVSVDLIAARPGETADTIGDRRPLRADQSGSITLEYGSGPAGWTAPTVFIRLHNNTDRHLYCVLLDLTDRFKSHCRLFSGDLVAPHFSAWAARGEPIVVSLPRGRKQVPAASGTDWLKILVAEEPFNATPFELPQLGEPVGGAARGARTFRGVLDRLGLAARHRDVEPLSGPALDWTTGIVRLVTRIPDLPGETRDAAAG
jgi:hypothetical protein